MDNNELDKYHIGVLDGLRAMALLFIVWFHFWQQSWILAGQFDWIPRYGYLFVDMMILLSGFCLFLPYARKMVYGEDVDSKGEFYKKRIARIMPSYYISILIVLFLFALPKGEYHSGLEFAKDFFTHIFFIHNLFPDVLANTHLNGVLWTVALEVQFYIFFPFIAKAFTKKPILTYIAMILVGLVSCITISINFENLNQLMFVNHPLTFVLVFANGMLGAWIYMRYTKYIKHLKHPKLLSIIFTILAILCIFAYRFFCTTISEEHLRKMQIDYRFILSILFLIFILSTSLSVKFFRKIFDNKLAKFLSTISFNLYIWHQFIAVCLKEYKIPFWEGDVPPNMSGNTVWQWKYFILCIIISFAVSCFMTFAVEKPIAKKIKSLEIGKLKNKRSNLC